MPWSRPEPDEYNPYYLTYIGKIPDAPIFDTLERQLGGTLELLAGLDDERACHRYAPDKWSVKEVVGHVIDTERVFAYRALSFARRAPDPLPGMEQNEWAAAAPHHRRPFESILDELRAVRRATWTLFSGLGDEAAGLSGMASGFSFTVRSLAWIIAGHELHHRQVLAERYLGGRETGTVVPSR